MKKDSSYQSFLAKSFGMEQYFSQEDMPLLLDYPDPEHFWGWDYEMLMFSIEKFNEQTKPFFVRLSTYLIIKNIYWSFPILIFNCFF